MIFYLIRWNYSQVKPYIITWLKLKWFNGKLVKYLGKIKMKCVQCGTSNVNEMLVSFIAEDESGQGYEDITTFPNLLNKISNCETKT